MRIATAAPGEPESFLLPGRSKPDLRAPAILSDAGRRSFLRLPDDGGAAVLSLGWSVTAWPDAGGAPARPG